MYEWETLFLVNDAEDVESSEENKVYPSFSSGRTPWIYESTFKRKKRKNEMQRTRSLERQKRKQRQRHRHKTSDLKNVTCILVDSKCISCFVPAEAFEYKKQMQWYILPNKKECPCLLQPYLEKANKGLLHALDVQKKIMQGIPPFPFLKNGVVIKWDNISIADFATIHYMIYVNQRTRFSMKRLVSAWILKRRCKLVNETDPYTLEEPVQPINIVDWDLRRIYRFEAKNILVDMIEKLLMSDNLFFTPKRPRNPLTNLALTYGQLYSIWKQLRAVGRTHWILEAFAKCDFEFLELRQVYKEPLQKASIEKSFSVHMNPTIGALLLQFIIDEHDVHNIYCDIKAYNWCIDNEPTCEPIQKWKRLCCRYYIFYVGNYPSHVYETELYEISLKTRELCELSNDIYVIMNAVEQQMCDL